MKNVLERFEDFKDCVYKIMYDNVLYPDDLTLYHRRKLVPCALRQALTLIFHEEHYKIEHIAVVLHKDRCTIYSSIKTAIERKENKDKIFTEIYNRLIDNDKEKLHCRY